MTAERPSDRYLRRRLGALIVLFTFILIGVEAGARAEQAVGQPEEPVVAKGVTLSGVDLSGMTAVEAESKLEVYASRPVVVAFQGRAWRFAPKTLGADFHVSRGARAALAAKAGASLELGVTVDQLQLDRWERTFARRFDRKPRNATVVLRGIRPRATRSRFGRKLSLASTRIAILTALEAREFGPVQLSARILRPGVTSREVGRAIVIRRASNRLILYRAGGRKGMRVQRSFGVATGQASYPTPLGSFTIASKQRYPWWFPPDSDWAEGSQPIPPGPGNPLGTRWMGLSAPAVGIHGTPDAASIGYSASHGCIRMLVPEAEWLFERVREGTPVFIVDA